MRRNPLITQHVSGKKKIVSYGDVSMREAASRKQFDDTDENIIIYGPFGRMGEFFGFHPKTSVLYLFADPADRKEMYENLKADRVKQPPLFHRHRPAYGGHPGTLEAFWKNRATSKMMAAVQYYADGDTLVVTHMTVKPKWRRNRVNTFLVDWVMNHVGTKRVVFEEPTEEGGKFMKTYGGSEKPRGNPVKPCGPTSDQPYFDTWNRPHRYADVRGRYLYHVTPIKNLPLIKQRGLVPRSPVGSRFAGGRKEKALFVGRKMHSIVSMAKEDYAKIRPGVWVLLRIDTTKLPKMCLFYDHGIPDEEGWLWTNSKIPPVAISAYKKITVG